MGSEPVLSVMLRVSTLMVVCQGHLFPVGSRRSWKCNTLACYTPRAMLQPQELQEVGVLVLSVKVADEQAECLLSARQGHIPQQLGCRL